MLQDCSDFDFDFVFMKMRSWLQLEEKCSLSLSKIKDETFWYSFEPQPTQKSDTICIYNDVAHAPNR